MDWSCLREARVKGIEERRGVAAVGIPVQGHLLKSQQPFFLRRAKPSQGIPPGEKQLTYLVDTTHPTSGILLTPPHFFFLHPASESLLKRQKQRLTQEVSETVFGAQPVPTLSWELDWCCPLTEEPGETPFWFPCRPKLLSSRHSICLPARGSSLLSSEK